MEHQLIEVPVEDACAAGDADTDSEDARLPVVPLVTLAGSGTFAVWMSLTCLIC